jgi:hypothetical protein
MRKTNRIAMQNKWYCNEKTFVLQKEKEPATIGNGFSVRSEAMPRRRIPADTTQKNRQASSRDEACPPVIVLMNLRELQQAQHQP